ncbi:MAG: CvpA family protein [Lachnospiraceae bacterium]|nr:CvpA family protein [Lachnospiraceae bacterium]
MGTIALITTIVVVLFLLFCIFNGYRKGFLRIILTTLALVVTIVAAGLIAPHFSKFLQTTFIGRSVEKTIDSFVEKQIDDSAKDVIEKIKEAQEKVIDGLPLPIFMKKDIHEKNEKNGYMEYGVSNFKDYLSTRLSVMAIDAIAYIILLIGIYLILRILLRVIGVIGRVPIIRGVNRLFGAILGFVEGVLIIWCICLIVMAISHTTIGVKIVGVIEQSAILKLIYNNNLLLTAAKSIFKVF